ncbi:MAG: type II secretion system protein M [Gammaproteobacteria bacterium]|nr:type II secretion system protein M [Gammaproteobacteria bacterium]
MKLPQPVVTWYAGLAKREQKMVLLGLGVILLLILYLAVIQPLVSAHQDLDRRLQADRSLLVYMNGVADRLRRSTAPGGGAASFTGSVFSAVSAAARGSAINQSVQRLEQADNGGVRLTLTSVPFDTLVRWLEMLATEKGIVVESASIQGAQAPGTVNVSLTLNLRS